MATRSVSSKQIVDERSFLYGKEEGFLLDYLKELKWTRIHPVIEKPLSLHQASLLTPSLLTIFNVNRSTTR